MSLPHSSVGSSHRLRGELRRLRVAAKLTQRAVAEALDCSQSKIVRIESGAVGISSIDLRALLALYGVTDAARIDEMVEWGRMRRQHSWWDDYDLLDQHFTTFLGLEAAAVRIQQSQSSLVPGLLQTKEYAQAAIAGYDSDPDLIQQGVDARMRRQEYLLDADGPEMYFIMDEAAVRRMVGKAATMRAQLCRLVELAERSNIHIQVVPFEHGSYVGARGSFITLEFGDSGSDPVVFIEQPWRDELVQNDRREIDGYLRTFEELRRSAMPESEFAGFVRRILDQAPYGQAVA